MICRSGALTVSELAAVGVGAVLVPFPAAVDDHQTVNAQYLVREGAAVLIADRDLTAERLAAELQGLCAGRGKLLAMAERARLVARPRAAEELAGVPVSSSWRPHERSHAPHPSHPLRRHRRQRHERHRRSAGQSRLPGAGQRSQAEPGHRATREARRARRCRPRADERRRCGRRGDLERRVARTIPKSRPRCERAFRSCRAPRCSAS